MMFVIFQKMNGFLCELKNMELNVKKMKLLTYRFEYCLTILICHLTFDFLAYDLHRETLHYCFIHTCEKKNDLIK